MHGLRASAQKTPSRGCVWSKSAELENRATAIVSLYPHFITMACLTDRLPQNVSGPFYVDASCIDCDQCRAVAPQFFARNEDTGFSYVQCQPETPDEVAEVERIMVDCSVASIGNDGV